MTKLKKGAKVTEIDPTKELADEKIISSAIWECLKNNDPEGVIEVLEAHFHAINKLRFAHESNISRATLYHVLHSKNPTLKTLAKVVHAVV
jgi:DNA-binding phage protein